jgi:protein-disulfide isomerase
MVGGAASPVQQIMDRPARGPANAKVTIVEYGDYQCPFSARAYEVIENQVLKEYGNEVRFVFKDYPLASMHPWAEAAAVASVCVLDQNNPDAYWRLYHYFFKNQSMISSNNLREITLAGLQGSKVDIAKVLECFDNRRTQDTVAAEIAEGKSAGVNGTPYFTVNGRVTKYAPYEAMKATIDDAFAAVK